MNSRISHIVFSVDEYVYELAVNDEHDRCQVSEEKLLEIIAKELELMMVNGDGRCVL